MDSGEPGSGSTDLNWGNVGLAFSFIVFDAIVSRTFGLGVGTSLVTSAVRCVVQLTFVALILQKVFETNNPWAVAGIALLLNLMSAIETTINKAKKRYQHMFPLVLISMLGSTIPVSVLGIRFAMAVEPLWKPEQYIPVVGMLCGATISGIVVSVTYVLKELSDNRDKVEMYLAFGATRFEACKPIATEALRLALTPNINQMSVLGIIAIPGMMTGAILGGSSVQQAARLQMVIMFMISSSTALASILTTGFALATVVDSDHRIRSDRIDSRKHVIWRTRDRAAEAVFAEVRKLGRKALGRVKRAFGRDDVEEEEEGEQSGQRLLG